MTWPTSATALPAPAHLAHLMCLPTRCTPQGKTRLARAKYGRALKVVERAMDLETEEQVAAASRLKASCLLNMARCAEREQEWGEARSWCTKAIKWVLGWGTGARMVDGWEGPGRVLRIVAALKCRAGSCQSVWLPHCLPRQACAEPHAHNPPHPAFPTQRG